MQFVDEAVVYASSGKGGDGHVSFRREKFVPRGGPDGGDGGDGGAVIFEATARRNTLADYRWHPHQRAKPGVPGGKKQMTGARGEAQLCPVPIGTILYDDETGERLADLDHEGARWEIPGGAGGLGNMHFASSTNRTPRQSLPGEPGVEMRIRLELKVLADVGLLGVPNAGKSTLLSRVSAAKPKVADYPFTTLRPQLGVVSLSEDQSFILADIPGLIEGASYGAGLGYQFLKHLERCACHLHLVSPEVADEDTVQGVLDRFTAILDELKAYGEAVAAKPQLVALNKIDLLGDEEREALVEALEARSGARVFPISAVTGQGVSALIGAAWQVVQLRRAEDVSDDDTPSGDVDGEPPVP